ncbi:MAG: HK97 gp10 family phage protein [Lachnospiraceae bacterium]|nr:HK97 gp10 family phage protein [Lachnospiraceae bacterium]
MVSFSHKGNFEKTKDYFSRMKEKKYIKILEKYGIEGVEALAAATPIRTGKTAASWDYEIHIFSDRVEIHFINRNLVNGECVALLIQYGHGTKNGGYVRGRDYINPALQPVFDKMANDVWKEVIDG